MKKTPWEKWEVDFLREVAATMPVEVIAEKLERTEKAVMGESNKGLALTLLADFVEDDGQEPKYHFSVSSPQKK
ncbi:prophage protein [Escherichia coli]|uniref:Prophage protein n=1 Tax=Escherichia coli TaxID=562 RepID=A0A3S4KGV8_ECOLX|nr:prophage protein [Escherichia coli]